MREGVHDVDLLSYQQPLLRYTILLTAVIFSFLKYGFHPTLMTIGQTLESSAAMRRGGRGVSEPDSEAGTESGGYGAV
jgi:hypothetical protein